MQYSGMYEFNIYRKSGGPWKARNAAQASIRLFIGVTSRAAIWDAIITLVGGMRERVTVPYMRTTNIKYKTTTTNTSIYIRTHTVYKPGASANACTRFENGACAHCGLDARLFS